MFEVIYKYTSNYLLINPKTMLLYTDSRDKTISDIRNLLNRNGIEFDLRNNAIYKSNKGSVSCTQFKSGKNNLYIIVAVDQFSFNGSVSLVDSIGQFGTDNYVLKNNNVSIDGPFTDLDRYSFYDVNKDIVSVGNFDIHFGEFMNESDINAFIRNLFMNDGGKIRNLLDLYAPIVFKSKVNKVFGYMQISKLINKMMMNNIIENYCPLNDAKYCLLVNNYPMSLKFDRVSNGKVEFELDLYGRLEERINLPQYDPYIIVYSQKSTKIPSIPMERKVYHNNKLTTVQLYISVLNFKNSRFMDGLDYSWDLLTSL